MKLTFKWIIGHANWPAKSEVTVIVTLSQKEMEDRDYSDLSHVIHLDLKASPVTFTIHHCSLLSFYSSHPFKPHRVQLLHQRFLIWK